MDPHLAVINLRTGEITRRFGRHGLGAGELTSPSWSARDPAAQSRLWVFDQWLSRLVQYDLRKPDELVFVKHLLFDSGAIIRAPVPLGSAYVMTGMSPDHVLFLGDSSGHLRPSDSVDLPFSPGRFSDARVRLLANMRSLAVDPRRERLVLSYRLANRLDFFRTDGGFLWSASGPRAIAEPRFRLERGRITLDRDSELAYGAALAASSKHVYAVWCGCTTNERERGEKPRLVHVYRWTGEFVREFALPGPVSAIAVSDDDRFLYTVRTHPQQSIEEWELPPIPN